MTNCIFEPRTDTSSATICKHCGQEKFLHIQLPQQEICISCNEEKGTHKICMDCIGKMIKENQQEKSLSDKWKEYQDWLNETPEISDEEIKKGAIDYLIHIKEEFTDLAITSFITGCVWYREQLKSNVNGK